jgi:hypothetical protein
MKRNTQSHLRIDLMDVDEVNQLRDELNAFESQFHYPLEPGVQFQIDHGTRYSAFFEQMGDPLFLVVRENQDVIGMIVVVRKDVRIGEDTFSALYLADLKVHPSHQGHRLVPTMYRYLRDELAPSFPQLHQDIAYFVAMQGDRGDVMDLTLSGSPLRHFREIGSLMIYFVSPEKLAHLPERPGSSETDRTGETLFLTPPDKENRQDPQLVDLSGTKDLILDTTGRPLDVVHLPVSDAGGDELWSVLRQCGHQAEPSYSYCCFSLDRQRSAMIEQLAEQGIQSGSRAKVYALSFDLPEYQHISIGTFEI